MLLVAVGRGPNTAGCGFDEAGIEMDHGYVRTDDRLRTNLPNVHAVGDIVPGLQFAHRGFQQGIFVAEEIAGRNPSAIDESGIPRVTYSHPEVASRYGRQRAGMKSIGASSGTWRRPSRFIARSSWMAARISLGATLAANVSAPSRNPVLITGNHR